MSYRLRFLQAPTATSPWIGTWIDEPLSFVRRAPVRLQADSLHALWVAATARGLPTDGLPTDDLDRQGGVSDARFAGPAMGLAAA